MRTTLLALLVLPPLLAAQQPDARRAALEGIRRGARVRLQSADAGRVEGRFEGLIGEVAYVRSDDREFAVELGGVDAVWTYRDAARPFMIAGAAVFSVLTALVADALAGLDESGGGGRGGAIAVGAAGGAVFGAGLGAVVGGVASGWEQRYPSRLEPRSWTLPVYGAAGPLRVDLRFDTTAVARGDSVRAHLTWTNASSDTLELLEVACGPLLTVLLPGGREHFASPGCAAGLAVVRLAPGVRTLDAWLHADLPRGTYQVEHRTFVLAPVRRFPLDVAGADRVTARAGVMVR